MKKNDLKNQIVCNIQTCIYILERLTSDRLFLKSFPQEIYSL